MLVSFEYLYISVWFGLDFAGSDSPFKLFLKF